jgi:hypothetical protein
MSCPSCNHFEDCSAPICPEDAESMEHGAWFADEEICRRIPYRERHYIRAQRRIAQLTACDPNRGCFTVPMLDRNCRLTHGIRGLDPEIAPPTPDRVARWLNLHPPKRQLSEDERAARRALAVKMRAKNTAMHAAERPITQAPATIPAGDATWRRDESW